MASIKDIVFTLQQHPFKGLMVKASCLGKAISPYSSGIPSDIRQILRYVLLHKDISEELTTLLDKYSSKIKLQLKIKHNIIDCKWDPSLNYEKKITISYEDESVVIHSEGASKNVVFLSNQFCYLKSKNVLGRVINANNPSSIKLLAEQSGYKGLADILDKPLETQEFNQLLFYFDTLTDIKKVSFLFNNTTHEPDYIKSKLAMNINYDDKNHVVLCNFYYQNQDSKYDIGVHVFKIFSEIKENQFELSKKRKHKLMKWFVYYAKASDTQKERLKSHFLPKIINEKMIEKLNPFIAKDNKSLIYKVFVDKNKWVVCEIDYHKESCFWAALGCLFDNYLSLDNDIMTLKIDKQEFNQSLKLLQQLCDNLNCKITYENHQVEIAKKSLTLDLTDMETIDDNPIIKLNDELLTYEKLIELKTNLWAHIDGKNVSVLDDVLINHCESILEVIEFQKKAFPKTEEFPVQRISHLLDWVQLKASGISITLSTDQEKKISSFMSFKSLKPITVPNLNDAKPREYQKDGLNWMMFLYQHKLGAVLADDMGLGKTFQSLMLLAAIKENDKKHGVKEKIPHLIVVPPSLIYNWSHEIERFCIDMVVSIYVGPSRSINPEADIIITSYELLRRDYNKLAHYQFNVAIFDEAQFIKNHMSARSKAAQQIKRQFCLCLTGTPIENNVGEYMTILNTILPGFFPYSKQLISSITEQHVSMIVKRSKPFVLRRLKNQISHELKSKTEEDIFLTMSPAQEKMYNSLVVAIRKQVANLKKKKEKNFTVFTALMRLRQACVSPYLIDESFAEITPKFTFLIEKLKVLKDEGHSVLVFSQFIKSLDIIENLCKESSLSYFRLDGSVSAIKRKQYIDEFQQSKEPNVFLMSLKAGGVGLNLTKASYVFHLDPWWNPAVENQATDRVHRIGQEQRVFSYKLIMHNSIEEKIQEIKEKKAALFNMLLDDSAIVNRDDVLTADDFLWLLEN